MDAFEYLMFRGEHDPSTRSSMAAVYVLDGTPAWDRATHTFEQASRCVLRLPPTGWCRVAPVPKSARSSTWTEH